VSEQRALLCDTAEALFASIKGQEFNRGWAAVEEAGFPSLLIPQEKGGFGGDAGDLSSIARLAGHHALPLPLCETIVVAKLLGDAGLAAPPGASSFAADASGIVSDNHFTGEVRRVAWGRHLTHVVAPLAGWIIVLPVAEATVHRAANPAGEPRDTLMFANSAVITASLRDNIMHWGALLRAAQIAGALDRALSLSVDHVNQRQQFGKPLAKFQAVQQSLAVLAIEAVAANVAAAAAVHAYDRHGETGFEAAAAKLRANRAAAIGITIAHQVHGAIGFTHEYPLHHLTRRLMGWRSEFGNEAYWAERLGDMVARGGAERLWPMMTDRSD